MSQRVDRLVEFGARAVKSVEEAGRSKTFDKLQVMIVVELGTMEERHVVTGVVPKRGRNGYREPESSARSTAYQL